MSKPRFSMVPAGAVTDERLSMTDIRVLGILGTFTNNKGWCFPKQDSIAALLKRSRPVVNAALARLEACGYVESQKKKGGANRKVYRVVLDQKDDGHDIPDGLFEAERDVSPTDISPAKPKRTDVGPADMSAIRTCLPSKHVSGEMSAPQTGDVGPADIQRELEPTNYKTESAKPAPKPAKMQAPHNLPGDWDPRDDEVREAESLNFTRDQFDLMVADFRAHWHEKAARNIKAARKSDWDLAFRKWMHTQAKFWRTDKQPKSRLIAAPAQPKPASWSDAVTGWLESGVWADSLGPTPDKPGFRGPAAKVLSLIPHGDHSLLVETRKNLTQLARKQAA